MVKIVLFVINGLMNFKEESMKYLKQSLQILCLLAFASSAFAQTHEVLMKNRGTGDQWSMSQIIWRSSQGIR